MEIAFIGLGRMGAPMALNLLAAGHALHVHDIDPRAEESVLAAGARRAPGPAAAARVAEAVISSVPGPAEVDAVMTGEDGVLAAAREGLLVIETSTIGPGQSRDLARRFAERGADYVDAPVNRIAADGAARREMTIMVGGDANAFARARPVLECLGDRIHHVGPTGTGNAVKLLNQMIYLSSVAVFCEGLALGQRLGVPLETLLAIFETSAAGHPMIRDRHPRIAAGDESPGFAVDRVLKDLGLADALRAEAEFAAPGFAAALAAYRRASEAGYGAADMTVLHRLLAEPRPEA